MKHVITSILLGLSALVYGQGELPPVPASEDVNLRLELASVEMERAADFRELSVWVACTGALFVAADRINNRDSDGSFAMGVASVSLAAYVGLNGIAIRRDRRAARLLHGAQ